MNTSQIIAFKIKQLSKQQGRPINKMLSECGMNRNFIYDLEKKEAIPSIDKLIRIADYFTVSIDYLLDRPNIYVVTPPQGETINKNVEENGKMERKPNGELREKALKEWFAIVEKKFPEKGLDGVISFQIIKEMGIPLQKILNFKDGKQCPTVDEFQLMREYSDPTPDIDAFLKELYECRFFGEQAAVKDSSKVG